jgi:putative oxidoreductase
MDRALRGKTAAMSIFVALVRVLVGGLFVGHGTQKLFGWFGGHGLEGTGRLFDDLGLAPGKRNATLAGAAEAGGGALLAAGLATPLAGAALTGTMVQAIRSVHAPKGPWVTEGGWEYNAVLIGTVLAVVEAGGGALSLDGLRGRRRQGPLWALLALGAGVAGPLLLTRTSSAPAPEPEAATAEAPIAAAPAPASA